MVSYEWTVETLDGEGEYCDIVDTCGWATLQEARGYAASAAASGKRYDLVLVRHVWDGVDLDLEDRQWAYVTDGKLPESFDGGAKVPRRFVKELAASSPTSPSSGAGPR